MKKKRATTPGEAARLTEKHHRTDLGNARRFVIQHSASLKFCSDRKVWYHYDGRRWKQAKRGEVARCAHKTVMSIHDEARVFAPADDGAGAFAAAQEERKELSKWAFGSESKMRIEAMVKLAEGQPEVVIHVTDFDTNPWLLNVYNGTLDLKTLTLRPHDRADMISKLTKVKFDPDAQSALFDRVLNQALPDPQVRKYLQLAAGYTLTGEIGEDVLFLFYGQTRTMKGTILSALASAMGEYAVTCPLKALAKRDNASTDNASPSLMQLRGARMAAIYETGKALKFDAELVKTLTGSDPVTGRDLYEGLVTFEPHAKFFIATNFLPGIDAEDAAMWERIRQLPFDVRIAREERDKTIRARLRNPNDCGPAVLAWAARGVELWRKHGLGYPPAIEAAVAKYQEEMDPLTDFLAACCVPADRVFTKTVELRGAYDTFSGTNGTQARYTVSPKTFGQSLTRHGYKDVKRYGARGWLGIMLTTDVAEQGMRWRLDNEQEEADRASVEAQEKLDDMRKGTAKYARHEAACGVLAERARRLKKERNERDAHAADEKRRADDEKERARRAAEKH